DLVGDLRRNEAVDRLSAVNSFPYLGGGNRHRWHLEERDAFWRRDAGEGLAHSLAGDARPQRDPEPDELEYACRIRPAPEVVEFVTPDDEDRILRLPFLERVGGTSMVV